MDAGARGAEPGRSHERTAKKADPKARTSVTTALSLLRRSALMRSATWSSHSAAGVLGRGL